MHYARFDAPDLAPVIVCERTATGWRGLTADGELLNVTAPVNGAPVALPESIAVQCNGETIGYRALPKETTDAVIGEYESHLARSNEFVRANEPVWALSEIEAALNCARTAIARYNRAIVLLSLGRWSEGFEEFRDCEQNSEFFIRPQYRAAIERGLQPWQGEDIAGKKLLLIQCHGFGDTIQQLRYVSRLQAMGADVVLQVQPALERLASQCAPVTQELIDADYFCSFLTLLQIFHATPNTMETAPYLKVDPVLVDKWRDCLSREHKRIGIAWSVRTNHDDDYPRAAPLAEFCKALGKEGELISVQQQGSAEADMLGVLNFRFEDFADCAALMSLLDEIVTIDTAAVHLAGAIGHECISLVLSHWSSWRWQAPLYCNIRLCRQDSAGDWESAFAKRDGAFAR
jgi:hypothetical protein